MKTHSKTQLFALWVLFSFSGFSALAQQTVAEWNFPNNPDNATVDLALPMNAAKFITTQGGTAAVGYTQAGNTTFSANCTGWDGGTGIKNWELTIETTGCFNLSVSSRQFSSATGPRDFKIQYRVGAGIWTDLPGATAIVLAANWTTATAFVTSVPLPVACENQPAVSLRWIMTTNTAVGGLAVAAGGNSRIDDINISWNLDHYYRSVVTGNWTSLATWESSPDNISWNPAVMLPTNLSRTITIRSSHIVTVSTNIRIDETLVENGGTLNWTAGVITMVPGAGVDLQVDGTLSDNSASNVTFNVGATWALGANGTVIKTSMGSANNWRDNYNLGIVTIPATATWIVRKTGVPNPSVSTINMYYPNLFIENNTAGTWLASGASGFQGNTTNTVIKGNMDVGGSGSSFVEFENINNNVNPTVVLGSLTIRTGNILRNYGTGFEIYGNLTCEGTVNYDANDARRFVFTGSGPQSISGGGTLNVFNMVMNKSLNDLTLNRTVKVDNNLTFNTPGGRIFSSTPNLLIIEGTATVTNTSNTGFVHGPVRKLGTAAFTFPVGKNNDYQALGLGAGSGGSGAPFWTEDFGTGCSSGLTATGYSGTNGAWNITNTGLNESDANTWYVSASENGMPVGSCGAGCGTNRTLHVGSTFPVDIGAAYLETDAFTCSFIAICSATDKRVESPVINCTGQTGITLAFNYIEFGEGSNDNATLWYYDGVTWSQLSDPAKTLCCGSATCNGSLQGLWTAYSIALPASANNNANVRIGFRWVNNANGIATDPSFAVDDITLSVPATAESFTVEYFHNNPQTTYNNVLNPPLNHISQCEYWTVTRDAGSSNRLVTLTWDTNSCGVTNLADLTVARFNGLSWDNRGNGGTTGTTAAGTITSAAAQTAYGPFTLASITTENPLPVSLLDFSGKYVNDFVKLKWQTASEINSDHFTIMRSNDGLNFSAIGSVKAAGNSNTLLEYYFDDREPLPGIGYYRLDETDFDGTVHRSASIAVKVPGNSGFSLVSLVPSQESQTLQLNVYMASEGFISAHVFDATGKLIFEARLEGTEGVNSYTLLPGYNGRGVYAIRLVSGDASLSHRFVY